MAQPEEMYQFQNTNCGYIYNPDKGDRKGKIPAGTSFADLPDEWRCPICGGTKKCFRPLAGPGSTQEVSCPTPTQGEARMQKYVCNICGYVYDPADGDRTKVSGTNGGVFLDCMGAQREFQRNRDQRMVIVGSGFAKKNDREFPEGRRLCFEMIRKRKAFRGDAWGYSNICEE